MNGILILTILSWSVCCLSMTSPSIKLSEPAKDAYGSLRYMNQYDAVKYCASKGSHLPSAREFAKVSMDQGAKGFCVSYEDKECYLVHAAPSSTAITRDTRFYFSYSGYQRPAGEIGDEYLWTSSLQYQSNYEIAVVFHRDFGGFGYDYRDYRTFPVRCASGKQIDE